MDIERIVSELKKERDHLDRVIALLARADEGGNPSEGSRSACNKAGGDQETPSHGARQKALVGPYEEEMGRAQEKKSSSTRKQAPKAA